MKRHESQAFLLLEVPTFLLGSWFQEKIRLTRMEMSDLGSTNDNHI